MGKRTLFEGELDHAGRPVCGESFMGGTICTLPPNHSGACDAICQTCGGNWFMDKCICHPRCLWEGCENRLEDDLLDQWCDQHMCCETADTDYFCNDKIDHSGPHAHRQRAGEVTPEELAEVYNSIIGTPMQ